MLVIIVTTAIRVVKKGKTVKSVVLAVLLAVSLAGCSVAKRMGMRSSTVPVYLVMGGELYSGEAQGFADRRASISVHTDVPVAAEAPSGVAGAPPAPAAPAPNSPPPVNCAGTLAFTAERSGQIELTCSNGRQARLAYQSTDWATGFAYSPFDAAAPASLTYGLAPEQAAAYLRAPAGKRLVVSPPDTLKLE